EVPGAGRPAPDRGDRAQAARDDELGGPTADRHRLILRERPTGRTSGLTAARAPTGRVSAERPPLHAEGRPFALSWSGQPLRRPVPLPSPAPVPGPVPVPPPLPCAVPAYSVPSGAWPSWPPS